MVALASDPVFAQGDQEGAASYSRELAYMLGLVNYSYQEGTSSLKGENQLAAFSGSVANISAAFNYRFLTKGRYSFYTHLSFPLMPGEGTYIAGGGGIEYHFGEGTTKTVLRDATSTFSVTPRMRYFLLFDLGAGYLAYNTETAKKNDTLIDTSFGAGLIRKVGNWNVRAQATYTRGVGIVTTGSGIKIFVGPTTFFD